MQVQCRPLLSRSRGDLSRRGGERDLSRRGGDLDRRRGGDLDRERRVYGGEGERDLKPRTNSLMLYHFNLDQYNTPRGNPFPTREIR